MIAASWPSARSAATSAFAHWRRSTATERSQLLQRWHQLMLQQRERLAQLLGLWDAKTVAQLGERLLGRTVAKSARRPFACPLSPGSLPSP